MLKYSVEKLLSNVDYYRSVLQIHPPPPFCNLSPSTKWREGGLNAGCNNFSRDYALPSGHEVIVGGRGVGAKCGVSPSARRRDAHNASGRLMSFSVEERGSRALPRSSWCVHC